MDILQKNKAFRNLIRVKIGKFLEQNSYALTYDTESKNQNDSNNWVFKLIYKKNNQIEIYNRDYRDYLEYFHCSIDGKEIFCLNINEYENLEIALENFKQKVQKLI